jgi:1,4-alpha-glucan branching enzyme
MVYKMPGDEWQQFASLRLLYTYMYTHPGAKLLFMGNEFAATSEWNYKSELQWDLLQFPSHGGMKYCVQKLNEMYKNEPALYEKQFEPGGFEWGDLTKGYDAVLSYIRKGDKHKDDVIVILNMTPVVRHDWEMYVHGKGEWKEIFNSDYKKYWGTGNVFNPDPQTRLVDKNEMMYEINVHLPPLGAVILK